MGLIIPIERIRKRMEKKEYIERDAVIEFGERQLKRLDDGEAYRRLDAWLNSIPAADVVERASGIIGVIPAADVRPAVLCKDCKYFSEVMYKGTQFEYGYCDRWADGTRMNPEDFCSRAAKREE